MNDGLGQTLAHQVVVVEDLACRAVDPLGWLAVQRQVVSYLRHSEALRRSSDDGLQPDLDHYGATMRRHHDGAALQLRTVDPTTVRAARLRLGIRVALIGKGGAGKTFIASTLARSLARRGRQVLAADLDTNPGLAISLGLGLIDVEVPRDLVEECEGSAYGWRLASEVIPRRAVAQFATEAPDGVRFLALGKIGGTDRLSARQSVVALRPILLGFGEPDWDVIADLEAGPTTPFERYHEFADVVVVVVGPAWRSAMTARRLLPMVGDRRAVIVANRFKDEPDHAGLTPTVRIPFDPAVVEAERQGLSPMDACPGSHAIQAIDRLAEQFLEAPVQPTVPIEVPA